MFNSSNRGRESAPSPSQPANGNGNGKRAGAATGLFSVIGPDVTVTGNIVAAADLHVDGRVEGDVVCGALTQGTDSAIHGGVTAETARIGGSIEGSVRVRQLLVERTARIAGDIEYETITIESGGQIDGALRRVTSLTLTPAVPALLPRSSEPEIEEAQLVA
ncbi:bactofilin family protein [Sphingomonas sp. DT-204]|uniref:bactofilin family protein n=1 Tax=Sphingomonas sp. DT-204 TaxID=3396166 RepID=UPI003F1A5958